MSRHQINQLPKKTRLIFPSQKNVQKNLLGIKLRYHNTRQYPVLTVTKSIQMNLLETQKLRRTDPTLLQLPLSETPSSTFLVTNYQDISTINTML